MEFLLIFVETSSVEKTKMKKQEKGFTFKKQCQNVLWQLI